MSLWKHKLKNRTGRTIETYGEPETHRVRNFAQRLERGAVVVGKVIGKGAATAGRYEKAHIKQQISTVREYAGKMADNVQAAEQRQKATKPIRQYSPPPVNLKFRRV